MKSLKTLSSLDVDEIDSKFRSIGCECEKIVEQSTHFYRSKNLVDIPCDTSRVERKLEDLKKAAQPLITIAKMHEMTKDMSVEVYDLERKVKSMEKKQEEYAEKGLEAVYFEIVKDVIRRDLHLEANFWPYILKGESDLFRTPQESYDKLTEEFKEMARLMEESIGTVTVLEFCDLSDEPKFGELMNPEEIFFPRLSVNDEGRITIFRMSAKPLNCDLTLHLENVKKEGKVLWRTKNLLYELSMLELQVSSIRKYEKIGCVVFVFEDLGFGKDRATMVYLEEFITRFGSIFKNLKRLHEEGRFFWYSGEELKDNFSMKR